MTATKPHDLDELARRCNENAVSVTQSAIEMGVYNTALIEEALMWFKLAENLRALSGNDGRRG